MTNVLSRLYLVIVFACASTNVSGAARQPVPKKAAGASYIHVTFLVDVSPQGTAGTVKLVRVEPGVEGAEQIAESAEKAIWTWSFNADPKTGKLERETQIVVGLDMSDDIPIVSKEFVPKR